MGSPRPIPVHSHGGTWGGVRARGGKPNYCFWLHSFPPTKVPLVLCPPPSLEVFRV
jgi:hypothetical protein